MSPQFEIHSCVASVVPVQDGNITLRPARIYERNDRK